MRIFFLTLFLYSSLFAAYLAHAGSNTLIANYPAPSGSYNKVVLEPPQATTNVDCSNPNNQGLLFMGPSNNLELCANSVATAVPYPETCFNRFCYQIAAAGVTPGECTFYGCPPGYSWGTIPSTTFPVYTDSSGNVYWVSSGTCCSCTCTSAACYTCIPNTVLPNT